MGLVDTLDRLATTRVNPLIWGPPGVGKTSVVRAFARRRGWRMLELVASIREPAEFAGFPRMTHDEFVAMRPSEMWRPLVEGDADCVLFLDEITCCPPAVHDALLRVVLDRVVGDDHLSPRCRVIAAANPPEFTAGRMELSDALASRFCHLEFRLDPQQWVEQFPSYWGAPPDLSLLGLREEAWSRARSMVAAYLRNRPDHLFLLPRDEAARKQAGWPNPRAWDFASQSLAACDLDVDAAIPLMAGNVGESVALEFAAWAQTAALPNPAELLADPACWNPPHNRLDIVYAALSSVVALAIHRADERSWIAAWRVLYHVAQKGPTDVAAVVARPLARARRDNAWVVPPEVSAFARVLVEVSS